MRKITKYATNCAHQFPPGPPCAVVCSLAPRHPSPPNVPYWITCVLPCCPPVQSLSKVWFRIEHLCKRASTSFTLRRYILIFYFMLFLRIIGSLITSMFLEFYIWKLFQGFPQISDFCQGFLEGKKVEKHCCKALHKLLVLYKSCVLIITDSLFTVWSCIWRGYSCEYSWLHIQCTWW